MATPRNPVNGQWTYTSPAGVADVVAPSYPQPGPGPRELEDPLPDLTFTPTSSPCQGVVDLTAVSTAPGNAGPCPTNPTTPMQDFGQLMGRTQVEFLDRI